MSEAHVTALWSDAVADDPYPWYADLRATGPVLDLGDQLRVAVGCDAVVAPVHDPVRLGFEPGIRYCLGASLARLEARIVAETLLRRTRSVEPTAPGTRTDGPVVRGFTRLPVHARAARSSR